MCACVSLCTCVLFRYVPSIIFIFFTISLSLSCSLSLSPIRSIYLSLSPDAYTCACREWRDQDGGREAEAGMTTESVLQFCCLDPSLAMRPIFHKYRAVVLTSGIYPIALAICFFFSPILSSSLSLSLVYITMSMCVLFARLLCSHSLLVVM
jgi:hypothetical protein